MHGKRRLTSILTLALAGLLFLPATSSLHAAEPPKKPSIAKGPAAQAPGTATQVQALCEQALAAGRDDPAGAMALVEKAVVLASQDKAHPLAGAAALNAAAGRARRASLPNMAERLASAALALDEKHAPGSLDVAASLITLGAVAADRGDLDAAQGRFEKALKIRETLAPGSLDVAASLNSLGGVARDKGDLDAARDFQQRALAIRETLAPGTLEVAASLNSLGAVAYSQGDLDAAHDYFDKARTIRESLAPGSLDVASSFNNLGVVASGRGEFDAAQDYDQRALAIREKLAPGSMDLAGSLNNLGIVANSRGDFDAALDYYQRALAIREKLAPGSLDVAGSLINLGIVANSRGDLDAAQDYFQRALAIQERVAPGSLDVAVCLVNLGNVADGRGDLAAERDDYQRALAIEEKLAPDSLDVARVLNNLGNAASDQGDLEAARDNYQRALAIREKLAPGSLEVAGSLNNLGDVAESHGDLDTAKDDSQRAAAIQEHLAPGSFDAAASLARIGGILRQQNHLAAAEEYLARSWAIVREQRRAVVGDEAERAFGARRADVAADLVRVRLAQGKTAAAFQTLEEGRAQGLMALLSERGLSGAGSDPDAWRRYMASERAFQDAAQQLAGADDKDHDAALSAYTQARLEQDRLLGDIRRSLPGLEPRSFTFEEARRALPGGSVFLAWMIGAKDGAVFVIPADPKREVEALTISVGASQLADQVAALRREIREEQPVGGAGGTTAGWETRESDAGLVAASRTLFDELLPPPARAAIARADRVIVSPDGPLWELPFAALVTNDKGAPKWLGLEKNLSYIPSLTILALEREQQRAASVAARDVLVVGDPVPGGPLPTRLPASGDEARQIAALYGAEPLLGASATEAAVRRRISGAAVVHLATHGYFHPYLAMSSGVLLTPPAVAPAVGETDNDGALQAWEFGRALPLQAELVVLSACETGRGEKVRGEGLVGLTRAIQAAGARSVVATQWSVPDRSTASLMVTFHKRLREGLPKDEALRRALAETAGKPATRHPYYWAAFFLTGDPDRPLGSSASR